VTEGSPGVVVVGAGPVGLALALGLGRHGVRTVLLERHDRLSEHSKAPGVHIRTREVLAAWGAGEALLREGTLLTRLALHRDVEDRRAPLLELDLTELSDEADAAGLIMLEQDRLEQLLLDAVRSTGTCDVRFGADVASVERRASSVRVGYRRGGHAHEIEAPFVVGCDGAGSTVREQLGLAFDGITYSPQAMLADVAVEDGRDAHPWPQVRLRRGRICFTVRLRPQRWRIVVLDRRRSRSSAAGSGADSKEVPAAEVAEALELLLGPGDAQVLWSSRFRLHRRAAPRFRRGPVLLAGDAAHVHSPVGGQGMNGGIQDAANLAWKLATALTGGDVERLLDSYGEERRSVVVDSTSRYTDLLTRAFLLTPALVSSAAFSLLRQVLRLPGARRAALRRAAMLDLRYRRSPLLPKRDRIAGTRLPDLQLRAPDGERVRLHALLGLGPAIVVIGAAAAQLRSPPAVVVRVGPGSYQELGGALRALLSGSDGWLLVRPDRHVACSGRDLSGPAPRDLRLALADPPR
jgi:2-polyprenyl-6-methoxyphenol hydroxylase-like FAD-dependent oxidoreductase